jgi:hypothetical protein
VLPANATVNIEAQNHYFTSGEPDGFRDMIARLIGVEDARVEGVRWDGNRIV